VSQRRRHLTWRVRALIVVGTADVAQIQIEQAVVVEIEEDRVDEWPM
jgi:hypothetical protein